MSFSSPPFPPRYAPPDDWFPGFHGRASRFQWWTQVISANLLVFLIQHPFLAPLGGQPAGTPDHPLSTPAWAAFLTLVIYLTAAMLVLTTSVRRFHDRNRSGWWVMVWFIPVIGQIWTIIDLGFLPGSRSPNRYG